MTTHLAQILKIIQTERKDIKNIYVSSHEIKWLKNMLKNGENKIDATHSNYRKNTKINCPTFHFELFSFEDAEKTIKNSPGPSIFFISHISRLSGEISKLSALYKSIKSKNSILIVDGSQSIGASAPFKADNVCDVYLGVSSKFIGAEPHLGFAFISKEFFSKYIRDIKNYPVFKTKSHARDIYSLHENLKNPLYARNYSKYILNLKKYALEKIKILNKNILFAPKNQAPHFLTLNFGSISKNKDFIKFAKSFGVIVSDNTNWSITEPRISLVRVGLSVKINNEDINNLAEIIKNYTNK